MTLTLTPQELRDLLDGDSPSITTKIVAPVNPPDGGHIGLYPSDPPKTSPYTKPFYPEDPTVWPAQVRPDPPVDMTPRVSCAPRGQD